MERHQGIDRQRLQRGESREVEALTRQPAEQETTMVVVKANAKAMATENAAPPPSLDLAMTALVRGCIGDFPPMQKQKNS